MGSVEISLEGMFLSSAARAGSAEACEVLACSQVQGENVVPSQWVFLLWGYNPSAKTLPTARDRNLIKTSIGWLK